ENDALRKQYWEGKKEEFESNCEDGVAGACFSLGEFYELLEKDVGKATTLYRKACDEMEHGNACFKMGQMFQGRRLGDEDEERKRQSFKYFERACKAGNSQGCANVGMALLSGFGCAKDPAKARQHLEAACGDNDALGCFNLGRLSLEGKHEGIAKEPKAAVKPMLKACNLGHPNACHTLAVMYHKGDGVPQSDQESERFRKLTMDIIKQAGKMMGATVV
ncbi:Cytochrome c oxidase assembly factor 7B (Beta-lactamase hcp-like protein) (Sel1 repeat-containing protein 1B), partial [Durusdinium trenchii]